MTVRYSAGKSRCVRGIVDVIRSLLSPGMSFWDPFCGSGKVIKDVRARKRYGSDIDPHVIDLLTAIQKGVKFPEVLSEDDYYYWKKRAEKGHRHPMIGFVGYGCSFGGKFFGGIARDKRTSRNFAAEAAMAVAEAGPALTGIRFSCHDYRIDPLKFEKGIRFYEDEFTGVIYCDIPYEGTLKTGSTKDHFNSGEFWDWAESKSHKSIVLVSEYVCPIPGAVCLWEKTYGKSLGKDGEGKGKKTERLFCLRPELRKKIGFGLPI
jgi:DNA adenine methylase